MKSIWSHTHVPTRSPLPGNLNTEVAIIGGGMAGILTAYYLQKRGKQVLVLEADRIGSGQTRGTTAKITSQHDLIYQHLIPSIGLEQAKQYAYANQNAIWEYEQLIKSEGISCHYKPLPAYLYSVNDEKSIKKEVAAARKLGIHASFTQDTELPFSVCGAIRFAGQAQFHPLEFLRAISDQVTVYEHTRVLSVKGSQISTNRGTVTANTIVFACHYPFINIPGFYFARMYQKRSYVLALSGTPPLHGMYLGIGKEGLSFRQAGDYLLLGGRSHRTGQIPAVNPYQSLQDAASHFYPGCKTVAHWSPQDCMPTDRIPFIGRFAPSAPNWYVATGFGKWGMTSSMVSALLLTDLICGEKNSYAEVFSPQRLHLKGNLFNLLSHMGESAKGLALGISPYALRCPHLGCRLSWNPGEACWECPCHGSRFHCSGQLITGPAQHDI